MDVIRRPAAWPWIGVLIGLLAMAPGLANRVQVETRGAVHELSMPDDELVSILHSGLDTEEVYGTLRAAGLRSVAVAMQTVGELAEKGRIILLDRGDLLAMQLIAGIEPDERADADGSYIGLVDGDTTIIDRISAAEPTSRIEPVAVGDVELHLVSGIADVEELAIGFDAERIDHLQARGIDIIARLPEVAGAPDFVRDQLAALRAEFDIDRVLFTGAATPFVGSPEVDAALAAWLADEGFSVITIEFTEQTGIARYIERVGRVVRLHSLNLNAEPDPTVLIGQGIRAAKERNIPILFVRPTTRLGAEARLDQLATVFGGISDGMPSMIRADRAVPFGPLASTPLHWAGGIIVAGSIGVAAGAMLGPLWAALGGASLILLALGAAITGTHGILADLLRLAVAVLFSVVAVFVARPSRRLGPATIEYLKSFAVVLAGGFAVVGLAMSNQFLVNAQDFWGVKALLLAPPAIVAAVAAYLSLDRPRVSDLPALIRMPIAAWHVVALGAVGVLLWYLILRSDNTGAASDLELTFRQQLENLLYVRPRIKEFLFGFPALIMGIVLAARTRHAWWLYAAAAVGTASAVDTFTHFHAPLLVSVLRTVLAVAIGYVLGVVGLWLVSLAERGARRLGASFGR